jgi:hypothetical protein
MDQQWCYLVVIRSLSGSIGEQQTVSAYDCSKMQNTVTDSINLGFGFADRRRVVLSTSTAILAMVEQNKKQLGAYGLSGDTGFKYSGYDIVPETWQLLVIVGKATCPTCTTGTQVLDNTCN